MTSSSPFDGRPFVEASCGKLGPKEKARREAIFWEAMPHIADFLSDVFALEEQPEAYERLKAWVDKGPKRRKDLRDILTTITL